MEVPRANYVQSHYCRSHMISDTAVYLDDSKHMKCRNKKDYDIR